MEKKRNRHKKWIRFRHKVVRNLVSLPLLCYSRLHYGFRAEPFPEGKGRQFLILMNHQTAFDQFFIGLLFKQPVYYVATEDIFSNGWISSLIRYLVAPIPIKKATADVRAVLNCRQVASEGGTIAIAPEGNRTYSGRTGYMKPAISGLIKCLKLPVAFVRIEGGYGVEPRWAGAGRKGKMTARVSRVMEPEEYLELSDEQLLGEVRKELSVDENVVNGVFKSKKTAERMERVLYVCPDCGLTKFSSKGRLVTCNTCGKAVRYGEDKQMTGEGFDFPYRFFGEWYDAQEAFVRTLDLSAYLDKPMFTDTARFSEVIPYKRKRKISKHAAISLFGDRLEINGQVYAFSDISAMSVLGKNKLNFYYQKSIYQFKGDVTFNALKYMNIYYHSKKEGEENEFLGL